MAACVRAAVGAGALQAATASATAPGAAATLNAAEDALDILEFAGSLFSSQRLWRSDAQQEATTAAAAAAVAAAAAALPTAGRHAALLRDIIWATRAAGRELEEGLLALLAARPSLPVVLRVASVLRRLRAQQAQARAKVAVERAKLVQAPGPAPPPSALSISAAQLLVDDLQDALWVRASFLAGREAGFVRDAADPLGGAAALLAAGGAAGGGGGAGAGGGQQQHVFRVIDVHRSNLLESATHFAALCNSVAPSPVAAPLDGGGAGAGVGAGGSGGGSSAARSLAAAIELASRLLLSNYVAALSTASLQLLTDAAAQLSDGAAAAAVAQQVAYAVRRSGRLGAVDGALLGAALLAPRLTEACVSALELSRRHFAAAFAEIVQSSFSDIGLRTHIAACFAALANGTVGATNALRSFWTSEAAAALGEALVFHVDQVVLTSERVLAEAQSAPPALLDVVASEMATFMSAVMGCAEVAAGR